MKRDTKFFRDALEYRIVGNSRMRHRVGIRRMVANDRIHEDRGVANGAGERSIDGGVVPLQHPERRVVRNSSLRRFEAVASGVTGGGLHPAASVWSGGHWN